MKTTLVRGALSAVIAASALAAAATAAATTVPVSGTQTVVNEKKGIYKMHGSLVGDWYGLSLKQQSATPTQFVASGRERFVGCIDSNRNTACDAGEASGSINFTYLLWVALNPTTKALLHGECLHPVSGGTGDFAHAMGVLHMTDTPTRTSYEGRLTYGATDAERVPTSARVC